MSERHPPLTPYPLDLLLGRIVHEWETRRRIFDLPKARFFAPMAGPDLSVDFLGRRPATPIGPAAGPHSQLAENIVLAWLGGARVIELKTVQILDELEIGRPCIDMQTVGYNIEWSQELKIGQSLEEYVKAWMIIEILKDWPPVRELVGEDPGLCVFDMSVGYDLAGISTPEIHAYVEGLRDATATIDALRPHIPEPFASYRGHDFPPGIVETATLSTFHGCPPDEIEGIVKHLMTEHELDVIVKLNPTLLGYDKVDEILHDRLGYHYIQLDREAFDHDLQFDRGVQLIGELDSFARQRGRRFGVKLTNTLVVRNHKGWMPDDPMYLSGPPLHPLSISLLDELMKAIPGKFRVAAATEGAQVSFSAGIDRDNFPAAVGLGLAPITISTDLLKPGGYGRFTGMLKALMRAMEEAGCGDTTAWQQHQNRLAQEAGHRDAVEAHVAAVTAADRESKYHAVNNAKLPRAVDHTLQMWGCVACNFCVTVCPNDAVLHLPTPTELEGVLEDRWQYLILTELCNECGNCLTFCPEVGDPAVVKPRLFVTRERWEFEEANAFLVGRGDDGAFTVTPTPDVADEVDTLLAVLNQDEGLPLRPGDLQG